MPPQRRPWSWYTLGECRWRKSCIGQTKVCPAKRFELAARLGMRERRVHRRRQPAFALKLLGASPGSSRSSDAIAEWCPPLERSRRGSQSKDVGIDRTVIVAVIVAVGIGRGLLRLFQCSSKGGDAAGGVVSPGKAAVVPAVTISLSGKVSQALGPYC